MKDGTYHPTNDQLQGLIDQALEAGDRAVVESHLLGCAECRKAVEEWRSLFSLLAALPHHDPAAGFAKRVMAHVKLPDPWYVRAAARARAQLQVYVPQTTRGWAYATASVVLPLAIFAGMTAWLFSRPYITAQGLLTFATEKVNTFVGGAASATTANVLQSDVALFAFRGLQKLVSAGYGTAGLLACGVAMLIVLSAWFLYQTLFRSKTTRREYTHVSYCL